MLLKRIALLESGLRNTIHDLNVTTKLLGRSVLVTDLLVKQARNIHIGKDTDPAIRGLLETLRSINLDESPQPTSIRYTLSHAFCLISIFVTLPYIVYIIVLLRSLSV